LLIKDQDDLLKTVEPGPYETIFEIEKWINHLRIYPSLQEIKLNNVTARNIVNIAKVILDGYNHWFEYRSNEYPDF